MTDQNLHDSRYPIEREEQSRLRAGLAFIVALALSLLAWRLIPLIVWTRMPLRQSLLLLIGMLVYALLVISLLNTWLVWISWKWACRITFLISCGLIALSLWNAPSLFALRSSAYVLLTGGGLGVFVGSTLVTGQHTGIWENNHPPSDVIQAQVHQLHREMFGEPAAVPWDKRLFDIFLAVVGLVCSAPVLIFVSLIIWMEDPGPIFFVKNSVGKGGVNFHQLKFRTMVYNAESVTGPILARRDDSRTLSIGRFLRKTALDELPQLFNILLGQMSFVGPRPQRTVLVYEYLQEIPEFAERHRVLPGLSGLAQVVGNYYSTPRQKLRFDRIYAQHASLGFDLKLLVLAFLIVFWLRWRPDWDGRIPRSWMRFGVKKN
jgi:lipopolysaccharide/colanic/teichoic acid biosynthesis glycosyltransferase